MKKMYLIKRLFLIPLLIVIGSCSKNDENSSPENLTGDSTPEEILKIFDQFEVIHPTDGQMVVANGLTITQVQSYFTKKYGSDRVTTVVEMSPNDQLLKLKMEIAKNQKRFTEDTNYDIPNQSNGLAYVDNGKDDNFHQPTERSICKEVLRGLDCSGLLYQGAFEAGVTQIEKGNVDVQSDPNNWKKWLENSSYKDVSVRLDNITTWNNSDWQEGDIIVFNKEMESKHIGTLIKENGNGELAIIHSQGSFNFSCDDNKKATRGPKIMSSAKDPGNWNDFTTIGGRIKTIHRLRFIIKDAYTLQSCCSGDQQFLYALNLKLKIDISSNYSETVHFVDNDGSNNIQTMNYSFNKETGLITFDMTQTDSELPDSRRFDVFTINIKDLGKAVVSVVSFINSTGCAGEFILTKGDVNNNTGKKVISKNTLISKGSGESLMYR